MAEIPTLTQFPTPGSRIATLAGRAVRFRLEISPPVPGRAFLRTTLGNAAAQRASVIDAVERGRAVGSEMWQDLPMQPVSADAFEILVPLEETGHFEARACFFLDGSDQPLWPKAEGNVAFSIDPAWTASGLGIYKAFVRLFGDTHALLPQENSAIAALDAGGFTVIPPSGKLRDLRRELGHIIDDLGFKIVMLLPIFPTPTTQARFGRFGSPYAARDFFAVDPALAEFDRKTTPTGQLEELADAVHAKNARLFIDIPINHTGWNSRLLELHPEWFRRNADGSFHSPGAWGVTWEDLVELDFAAQSLWREMAEVFLFWCRKGVDGFRCDAGYMVPTPVWTYISAKVRTQFPDTIFILEGLGGPIPKMIELMGHGGLNWAYSELFQNYRRAEIDYYLPQAIEQSEQHGLQVHFAETHDNNRLAAQGKAWAKLRTALCALCSPRGAWGITCGVEWLATEKIHVHQRNALNWGNAENLIDHIASLNRLLKTHPAFRAGATLRLITQGPGECLALVRIPPAPDTAALLILANLSDTQEVTVRWKEADFRPTHENLLAESDGLLSQVLAAGEVRWLEGIASDRPASCIEVAPAAERRPANTLAWPRDARREILWWPGHVLKLEIAQPFLARLCQGEVVMGHASSDSPILSETTATLAPGRYRLELTLLNLAGTAKREILNILKLGETVPQLQLEGAPGHRWALLTNGRGAMSQVRGRWGEILSQYDAFLLANPHGEFPVDRRVLFSRCRAWLVHRGYSTELQPCWVTNFAFHSPNLARWTFKMAIAKGLEAEVSATLELIPQRNALRLTFRKISAPAACTLILRPDLEDRNFHEKSHFAPEIKSQWLPTLTPDQSGFVLPVSSGSFHCQLSSGRFHPEPEILTVEHVVDAERGLGNRSDLFSPGWFGADFCEDLTLTAELCYPATAPAPLPQANAWHSQPDDMESVLRRALRQFIVKRGDGLTVIAGYPWFLDWGRDSLIVLRGMIAAGMLEEAREILKTFAAFEERGTIPNMIRGSDHSNRDTSDAPLWFCVAVADLLDLPGNTEFLEERCGERPLREIILSIARHYLEGTPNGVRVDPASGLVFSPAHFTWMDTNYPAATPRQGYPICLQAKWHRTLALLDEIDPGQGWGARRAQVEDSIGRFYWQESLGFLSDCLHATHGAAASEATPDDHLRPNQLFAITLGALKNKAWADSILSSCECLLVPGAIRTLADQRVEFPLPVDRNGQRLNDPHHPFWPHYSGDEDTRRKPAYHNGTAWPWVFPSYAEALRQTRGEAAVPAALGLLGSAAQLFDLGCLGQLPEIVDGGTPHAIKGCGAQGWSVSEWLRVLLLLKSK